MASILLVDDDIELVALLKEYLEQEGYAVAAAHDGVEGVTAALSGQYDLAVLDVMMPRMNGIEALRNIRLKSRLPVLMLTAMGDDTDVIVGLELGADDYVAKPCTPRELLARIRAILRRAAPDQADDDIPQVLEAGALKMWPEQRRSEWAGQPVELSSTEFNILEVLLRQAGRPVSKAVLSEQALGRPLARFERSIDVHISSIRHKLGQLPDGRSCIQTVHRLGYQLIRE
ncbi:MAG: response regulator transcription factor [Sulfuricella sp.]|nr:response regulator transcription factor [Sulfuricella sp.]